MNQEIKIRSAKPEDAMQLAELAQRGIPGYPFESIYDPAALRQEISQSDNRIVAVKGDQVVGTAVLGEGYMAEIKRVLVDPDKRGHGLGHLLTNHLKREAKKRGVVPWADVRADQIGMQKAAYTYDLKLLPTSVETGKHIVYEHRDSTGPARESMVHMSGLPLAKDRSNLHYLLSKWPSGLTNLLLNNMARALVTQEKDFDLVKQLLPSASLVKQGIEKNIQSKGLRANPVSPDILTLSNGQAECVVISPDASGFVSGETGEAIAELTDTALGIGLQIVTCYLAVTDTTTIATLVESGMEPGMIRPWQNSAKSQSEWQVGMRKTANQYQASLHGINLDPWVQTNIMTIMLERSAL